MSLITLFSAPKPFTDPHIALIQCNALHSWTLLLDVEVILLGNEEGLSQAAKQFGAKHIPNVKCNDNGTPLISSMFELARQNSQSELLCIINADIILMPDFVEAAKQVAKLKEQFVLLSWRWDLDIIQPIEFTEGWQSWLEATVRTQGQLHRPAGSDFFLFPKTCYQDIPNFTIGRAGWDNWMIYKARQQKWSVIDCTPSVMIVHQNHDYSHLPGGEDLITNIPIRTRTFALRADKPISVIPSWIQRINWSTVNLRARRCRICASCAAWNYFCARYFSSCPMI